MIAMENTLSLLFLAISGLSLSGLFIFSLGKYLPAKGEWLLWLGCLFAITLGFLDSGFWSETLNQTRVWKLGWVWPKEEMGALTIGLVQDPLGMAISLLVFILTLVSLFDRNRLNVKTRVEKTYSGLAFSSSGVALAWSSVTPWLTIFGVVLTIFGGFISSGSDWESDEEADKSARFLKITGSGLMISIAGACILAASRPALLFTEVVSWVQQADQSKPLLISNWMGSVFLTMGLLIQMQATSFVSSDSREASNFSLHRYILTQLFPALAALAMLFRLEFQFRELGLFPAFGWLALFCSVLAVFAGLIQSRWSYGFSSWLGSGFSLVVAMLAFSGPMAAFGMLMGLTLGSFVMMAATSALEGNDRVKSPSPRGISSGLKGFIILSGAASTGMLGFVSAQSGIDWILPVMNRAGEVAVFLCSFFFFVLLGWRLVWNGCRIEGKFLPTWSSIFTPLVGILLSLGVVWTGNLTGGSFFNDSDRVIKSAFSVFFGQQNINYQSNPNYIGAVSLYWIVLALALIIAFWLSGRKEDQWERIAADSPRFRRFVSSGYGISLVLRKGQSAVSAIGRGVENAVDHTIWLNWIPNTLLFGVSRISSVLNRFDKKILQGLNDFLRVIVEVPAKALQIVQTGDLRWYLIIALSTGFAVLLHFLYFLKG